MDKKKLATDMAAIMKPLLMKIQLCTKTFKGSDVT